MYRPHLTLRSPACATDLLPAREFSEPPDLLAAAQGIPDAVGASIASRRIWSARRIRSADSSVSLMDLALTATKMSAPSNARFLARFARRRRRRGHASCRVRPRARRGRELPARGARSGGEFRRQCAKMPAAPGTAPVSHPALIWAGPPRPGNARSIPRPAGPIRIVRRRACPAGRLSGLVDAWMNHLPRRGSGGRPLRREMHPSPRRRRRRCHRQG